MIIPKSNINFLLTNIININSHCLITAVSEIMGCCLFFMPFPLYTLFFTPFPLYTLFFMSSPLLLSASLQSLLLSNKVLDKISIS